MIDALRIVLMVVSLIFLCAILHASVGLASERDQYQRAYESARSEFEALARTRHGAVNSAFVCKARGGVK